MASLNIVNVEKHYGPIKTLKGVNIFADDGEFLVLLGPSGCGKSTLLSSIAGLAPVSSGEIMIDDVVVNDMESSERDIAMVFQSYALYPNMSVRKNLTFGMQVRGVSKSDQTAAVKRVATILQLENLLDRKPSQLSGGQRQRVAMGRAMVRQPKIFLFDEPLSNLDAKLRTDMRAEIKKLHQRDKTTTVYVTHDQIEAMTLATKIVVMHAGEVQQIGAPQEIYEKPANLFVAKFIGSPAMNCIEGKLSVNNDGINFISNMSTTGVITIPLGVSNKNYESYLGKKVVIGIRPEWINISKDFPTQEGFTLNAVVDVVEPTGADNFVIVTASGISLMTRLAPGIGEVGQKLLLAVDQSKILLFDGETTNLIQ